MKVLILLVKTYQILRMFKKPNIKYKFNLNVNQDILKQIDVGGPCIYLVVIYRPRATLVWSCLRIYICPVFLSVVYPLPLSLFFHSAPSIYTFLGKAALFFCNIQENSFAIFLSPFKYLVSFSSQ